MNPTHVRTRISKVANHTAVISETVVDGIDEISDRIAEICVVDWKGETTIKVKDRIGDAYMAGSMYHPGLDRRNHIPTGQDLAPRA